MRGLAWIAAAALAGTAGCGQSEDEKERIGFQRYKTKIERACRATADGIRKRGAPTTLQDLASLVARGQTDVLKLWDTIAAEHVPAGSRKRVAPFREAVESVRELLPQFAGATRSGTLPELADLTSAMSSTLVDLEFNGREAGIRCIDGRQREALEAAMLTPVYIVEFVAFDRFAERRLRRLRGPSESEPRELARYFDRLHIVVQQLRGDFDTLPVPDYAEKAANAYGDVIFDLELATEKTANELKHRGTITPAYAARVQRRLTKPGRQEPKKIRALLRTLRSRLPGAAGSEAAPA